MTTHKKELDSIQIKRKAQEKIYEAIKEMTPKEEIAYFRQSIDRSRFSQWWKSASARFEASEMR